MFKGIGKFEKVSEGEFKESMLKIFPAVELRELEEMYADIGVPFRATNRSAGYDFFAPFAFTLKPGEEILIPTGIRSRINDDWALWVMPKGGLGFKFRVKLNNTIGLIDADYYDSDNEGHIMAKITNEGDKVLEIPKGKGFIQGVFLPYGTVEDDNPGKQVRNGGFDSTNSNVNNEKEQ